MGSYTTNYSLYKPTPGSESTGWGALVNTGFDNIDSQVKANADAIAAGTAVIAKLKYYKTPTPQPTSLVQPYRKPKLQVTSLMLFYQYQKPPPRS